MTAEEKMQPPYTRMPLDERQQLVAGVFSSKAAADAAMMKIKGLSSHLQMVHASNILMAAKDNKERIEVSIIDIGAIPGVNIVTLAERIAASLVAAAGKPVDSPTVLYALATHLGYALKPGGVVIGLFVDPQHTAKIKEGLRKIDARILNADDLKRIGAGLGAAGVTNDLAVKAALMP